MSAWRYIMFQDKHGRKFPVIFPGELVHSHVAKSIRHAVRGAEMDAGLQDYSCPEPVSAGFIGNLMPFGVSGSSESLNLESHPDDKTIIEDYPVLGGRYDREAMD